MLAGGDLQSVNAQRHSLVFTVIAKLCVLEQIVAVKDLLMYPRFVALGLGREFHNAVQPLLAAFTCCQRASTPHRLPIGAIILEPSMEAATTEPVVSVPSITSGAPNITIAA